MPRAKKPHLKRRADGRYACRYKNKWFMGSTEDEALRAREQYKQAEKDGLLASYEPMTVAQYAAKWLPLHRAHVIDRTYNGYAHWLDRLTPIMGSKLLSEVTIDDAASVWVKCKWSSPATVRDAKMLYVGMFDTAVEAGYCRINPFRSKHAAPPKLTGGTHRALTDEEIHLIETTPHRMQTAAMIMLYAGLRRGEVAALSMSDIDLKAGIIHVTKAIRYEGSSTPVVVGPKTEAGVRDIPIFPPLRPFLENRIGLILPNRKGVYMCMESIQSAWKQYNKCLEMAAGHPVHIRFHDLRHTFCTMLRDAGVDMKQAMYWMGHADESMILRIYDHVSESRTKTSIDQVEKMLIGRQNGRQTVSHETKTL